MKFVFDTGGAVLKEIAHRDICTNAVFRLDTPMECTTDDVFVLCEGVWYKWEWQPDGPVLHPIEGSWACER